MADDFQGIEVRGAREHNLKSLNIQIPRNKVTVVTGLSGSGKSSLVFDTIFAEGQRRFLESMSTYARYFLEKMKRPELDAISGLQPTIAIDQKTGSLNPRSTVGTVTEAYDYLRLLFSKKGVPFCPIHNLPAQAKDIEVILSEIERLLPEGKFYVLAPVAQQKKGEFSKEMQSWQKLGILKAKIDGKLVDLAQQKKLPKTKPHDIELVIEQIVYKPALRKRLMQSLKKSTDLAKGQVIVETTEGGRYYFSLKSSCPECGFSFPELDPKFFSFNSPKGACPDCKGLGTLDILEEEVVDFDGDRKVIRSMRYKSKKEDQEEVRVTKVTKCPTCNGARLRSEALNVYLDNKIIVALANEEINSLRNWAIDFKSRFASDIVTQKIAQELIDRLNYLVNVGCGYLAIARPTDTLSGGEAQRLRLASQLGSNLTGILYVLDEPSIGLHPRDHQKLLNILFKLKETGNTILVVEHDEETIRSADYVIDVGPKAGRLGGEIIAQGTPEEFLKQSKSLTVDYLDLKRFVGSLSSISDWSGIKYFDLFGASGNNLKNVNLRLPIGTFVSVTGVSGSGKSTLIMDTLYPAVASALGLVTVKSEPFAKINGIENFDKIVEIDQRPIGRTSRSTPATYVDLAPLIRDVFALTPEAKVRGYEPNRFSYNSKIGQCPNCGGVGYQKLEMNFLSDVTIQCDDCQGRRFNRETLNVRFKNKSIADIFSMTVQEAHEFFSAHPLVRRKLETLIKVGLDYIQLGQGAPTLSGGEAQRVKLSKELSKRGTGKTLYILDEPTTGLHFEDVKLLVELLKDLVKAGNTVVVIEHNMDLVAASDWIIELGPEGGAAGGQILFQGPVSAFVRESISDSPTQSFVKTKFEQLLPQKK